MINKREAIFALVCLLIPGGSVLLIGRVMYKLAMENRKKK